MTFKKLFAFIALSFFLAASASALEEAVCDTPPLEQATIYYSKAMKPSDDPGKLYKDRVAQVNAIAKKHKFKNYKMTSEGISVSSSSYNGMYDVSINISIEYTADYKAITALSQGTDASNISTQRYSQSCH